MSHVVLNGDRDGAWAATIWSAELVASEKSLVARQCGLREPFDPPWTQQHQPAGHQPRLARVLILAGAASSAEGKFVSAAFLMSE